MVVLVEFRLESDKHLHDEMEHRNPVRAADLADNYVCAIGTYDHVSAAADLVDIQKAVDSVQSNSNIRCLGGLPSFLKSHHSVFFLIERITKAKVNKLKKSLLSTEDSVKSFHKSHDKAK